MSAIKFSDLVDMQRKAVAAFGPRRLFGTKKDGVWNWTTCAEFGRRVDDFRAGLSGLGVGRGDVVAIISGNREEWAVAAYATYGLGACFVPMYEHQLASEWEYIVADSAARLLIVTTKAIYEQVRDWPGRIPALKHVCCMELPAGDPAGFASLEAAGRGKPVPPVAIDPEAVCGFIYTSGTTGKPKGVLLSHRNLISNVNAAHEIFPLDPDDCSVSFLPWAHSFGQTVELHVMLSMGGSVAFAESVEKLVENFGEVRPTVMVSVPRIFNRIYDGLQKRMREEGGLKKRLFEAAMENEGRRRELAREGRTCWFRDLKHKIFDRLVFSKVRARFGGRLKYAFSGGAALSPEVAEFIDRMGIMVYEGYGLTETSPIATANCRGNRKIGSVGKALPGVTILIDPSVIEDGSGDGEVIVKGPNVMKGYHRLPGETAEVLTADGAFRTGDRGRLDADGYLYITGRIKEQYKLENGKYVVPAPLEEQIQLSPFIQQVFVDGANKLYNVALIVPDLAALRSWAREKGINVADEVLPGRREVQDLYAAELERLSKGFKGYERIKRFAVILEEFTTQNGMLTPTLKLKRRKVVEKYQALLDSLWS